MSGKPIEVNAVTKRYGEIWAVDGVSFEVRAGEFLVLTTHYMDEAEVLCDRVAILDRGRVLDADPPAALVRGLEAPTRIGLASGALTEEDAKRLADGGTATDDGVTLTITTRTPADVLVALSERGALRGLTVRSHQIARSARRRGVLIGPPSSCSGECSGSGGRRCQGPRRP